MTKQEIVREIISTVLMIVVVVVVVLGFQKYVAQQVKVDGHSMDTSLQHGERLLMWRLGDVDRFDVVVFRPPNNPDKLYIKRVIGMPGDTVEMKDDVLYINGQPLEEPYLNPEVLQRQGTANFTQDFDIKNLPGSTEDGRVPAGHYFVMGDNRQNSLDSREIGFIEEDIILGETPFVFWPLNRFGTMPNYELNAEGTAIVAP